MCFFTFHRLSHCSADVLTELGILAWRMNPDAYPNDPKLLAVRKVRGYNYEDIVSISPGTLAGYEDKIKAFYEEHIHTDEEIRCVLEGSGYFDIRDKENRWIRMWTKKGDLVALPEGIYHRFTLDENNYIKALRLFSGVPIWTPLNAPQEEHPSRVKYADAYLKASEA
jgi:1,2-dihydroxy-3-keto-5-methylthiopentene dioxygenase